MWLFILLLVVVSYKCKGAGWSELLQSTYIAHRDMLLLKKIMGRKAEENRKARERKIQPLLETL